MLLTVRYPFAASADAAAPGAAAAVVMRRVEPGAENERRSAFLGAVARRDALLLGIRGCGLLHHRAHQLSVGLDPVGDHDPFVAVPLLELDRAAAFVIQARYVQRLHEAGRAQLLQAGIADLQVLDSPAHLLGGDGLALAELDLRGADRLDRDDAVHHAAVVIDRADARDVFHLATLALAVVVLLDVLDHREVRPRDVEARRDEALGGVARGNRVFLGAGPPYADD